MSNVDGSTPPIVPSSRLVSEGPSTLDLGVHPTSESLALNPSSDLVCACLAVIEERHQGHISLAHATLKLIDLLPDNDAGNEAYVSYLDQLTEIDHE